MHMVHYKNSDNLGNVINRNSSSKTMLTEHFKMNSIDSYAKKKYKEFLEFYVWQRNHNILSGLTVVAVSPTHLSAEHSDDGSVVREGCHTLELVLLT